MAFGYIYRKRRNFMNDKEFEEFFKSLENNDNSGSAKDDYAGDEFVFSGFFEDNTTADKNKTEKPSERRAAFDFSDDDDFAPPPPEEDEDEASFAPPPSIDDEDEPQPKKEKESAAEKLFGGIFSKNDEKKKEKAKKEEPAPDYSDYEEPEEEPADDPKAREKRKRKIIANWLTTIIWVSGVLAVSVFIAYFALSSINDLVGFSKKSHEAQVVIPEGATLGEIADILKDNGIIDEPFTFEVYAHIKKMQDRLDAGTFSLNSNLGYDQIFQALRKKDPGQQTVTLTFYEGMTASQIAKKLEENGVCGYDEFMEAVDTASFDYEFESMMGTSEYIYHKWEGYLFPDTYEFYLEMKPRSVLAKFVDNFNNKITASYYERMQELGMSLDEVITLASVIQSEAATVDDMRGVSAVFHNRLESGSGLPYLQSDVTYFYYRDEIEPYVGSDEALDEAYHTSYDTYYKKGLPVGPVSNPGANAIEAALNPDMENHGKDYYFLADSSGKFYWAKTHEEHEANMAAAGVG